MFDGIVHSSGLQEFEEAAPALPPSLDSLGDEADFSWEYGLKQALTTYVGRILEFCVDCRIDLDNEKWLQSIEEIFEVPDRFIQSFRQHMTQKEQEVWTGMEELLDSMASKQGPAPKGSQGKESEASA